MSYKLKYEKYKSKYLKLKYYMKGGDGEDTNEGKHNGVNEKVDLTKDEHIEAEPTEGGDTEQEQSNEGESTEGGDKEIEQEKSNEGVNDTVEGVVTEDKYIYHELESVYIDSIKSHGLPGRYDDILFNLINNLYTMIPDKLDISFPDSFKQFVTYQKALRDPSLDKSINILFTRNVEEKSSNADTQGLDENTSIFLDKLNEYIERLKTEPQLVQEDKTALINKLQEIVNSYPADDPQLKVTEENYIETLNNIHKIVTNNCTSHNNKRIILAINLKGFKENRYTEADNNYNIMTSIAPDELYIKIDGGHIKLDSDEGREYMAQFELESE